MNYTQQVCRSDLRIATVGNRNSLLPYVKLTLHFFARLLKNAISNGVEYNRRCDRNPVAIAPRQSVQDYRSFITVSASFGS